MLSDLKKKIRTFTFLFDRFCKPDCLEKVSELEMQITLTYSQLAGKVRDNGLCWRAGPGPAQVWPDDILGESPALFPHDQPGQLVRLHWTSPPVQTAAGPVQSWRPPWGRQGRVVASQDCLSVSLPPGHRGPHVPPGQDGSSGWWCGGVFLLSPPHCLPRSLVTWSLQAAWWPSTGRLRPQSSGSGSTRASTPWWTTPTGSLRYSFCGLGWYFVLF